MAYVAATPFPPQFVDSNGDPLASGTVEFYLTGTSTPTAIYSDSSGTSLGTSVTLNSRGVPQTSGGTAVNLFFDTDITYKLRLKNSAGTYIDPDTDPFAAGSATKSYFIQDGTGATSITVQAKLRERVSVADYGAGTSATATENVLAIQQALDKVRQDGGGTVWFPDGTYKYNGTMFVSSDTTLEGESLGGVIFQYDGTGQTENRPAEGATPGLYVTFYALSRYRASVASNLYSDWATAPTVGTVSDWEGPHTNIRFKNLVINGAEKTSNKHQLASGSPVAGDVDNVDVISIDDATNVVIEDCNIPFAAECAIRFAGNTSTADAGSCDECRVINVVGDDVGKGVEASQNCIDVKIIDSDFDNCNGAALRLSDVQCSMVTGTTAHSNNNESLYYANQGNHRAVNNDLKAATGERVVRVDGAAATKSLSVLVTANDIRQGYIGEATAGSNARTIIVKNNNWLNEDSRAQGGSPSTFETNSSGFIFFNSLGATDLLVVDDDVWLTTSTLQRYRFGIASRDFGMPKCRLGLTGDFTCDGTLQRITFDDDTGASGNTLFDETDGLFDLVTDNTYDAPPSVYHWVSLQVQFTGANLTAGDNVRLVIREIGGTNPIFADQSFEVITSSAAQTFAINGLFDFRSNKEYEFMVQAPNTSVLDAVSSNVPVTTLSIMAVA